MSLMSGVQTYGSACFDRQHVAERDRGFGVDGALDGQAEKEADVAVMFLKEDEHGLVEDVHIAVAALLSALTFVVEYGYGKVIVLPAPFQNAVAQVYIFAIHEEIFV